MATLHDRLLVPATAEDLEEILERLPAALRFTLFAARARAAVGCGLLAAIGLMGLDVSVRALGDCCAVVVATSGDIAE